MPDIILRLAVLLLVFLMTCLCVGSGKRFIKKQRQQALAAPIPIVLSGIGSNLAGTHFEPSRVQILAFSSADCHQCYLLQAPALKRVLEARGTEVSVIEVDASCEPDLIKRYRILTVPSTVVLDGTGHTHAVNYGFANTQRLLQQVDQVLTTVSLIS